MSLDDFLDVLSGFVGKFVWGDDVEFVCCMSLVFLGMVLIFCFKNCLDVFDCFWMIYEGLF